MASVWGRTQAIKAAFVVGFLLLLLNLLGPRLDTNRPLQAFSARLTNFPKRTFTHNDMAIHSNVSSTTSTADVKLNATQVISDGNSTRSNEEKNRKPGVSFIAENEISDNSSPVNETKLYANSTVVVLTNNNHHHESIEQESTTLAPGITVTVKSVATPTKPKSRKEFIAALMQQLGINPCPMVPDELGE